MKARQILEDETPKGTFHDMRNRKTNRFQTSDGYTFYLVNGQWVDNLDPARVDMACEDRDGIPVDSVGEPHEGVFLDDNGAPIQTAPENPTLNQFLTGE